MITKDQKKNHRDLRRRLEKAARAALPFHLKMVCTTAQEKAYARTIVDRIIARFRRIAPAVAA